MLDPLVSPTQSICDSIYTKSAVTVYTYGVLLDASNPLKKLKSLFEKRKFCLSELQEGIKIIVLTILIGECLCVCSLLKGKTSTCEQIINIDTFFYQE